MKKILSVVLMLCLMTTVALAEQMPAVNWADFEPVVKAANITGEFHTFDEIAVKIWLPDGMKSVELTEEDKNGGYIGYFMPDDKSAQMGVTYVNVEGTTLEDYAKHLSSESDVTEVMMCTVNGLSAVSYKMPAQDSVSIAFATEAGYVLEVTCAPASGENAEMLWAAVMASIQAAQ